MAYINVCYWHNDLFCIFDFSMVVASIWEGVQYTTWMEQHLIPEKEWQEQSMAI